MEKKTGNAARKFFVLLVFLGAAVPLMKAETILNSDGATRLNLKTDNVTVYQQNAIVERLGAVSLLKGENRFMVENLPNAIIPDTLMAFRPDNTSRYIIKEFEFKEIQVQPVVGDKEKEFGDKVAALRKQIKAKQDAIEVLDDKIKFLRSISVKSTEEISKTLVLHDVNVKNTEELLAFISGGIEKSMTLKRELTDSIEKINNEITSLESQLAGLRTGGVRAVKVLFVNIEAAEATDAVLGVKYVVTGAGWTPYYETNLETAKSRIEAKMFAKIYQTTSEKWEEVKLTIATGTPAYDATLPELQPWIIDQLQVLSYYNQAPMTLRKAAAKSAVVAEMEQDKAEAAPVTRVESVKYSEISMQMKIKDRYNVGNTGEQKKVFIKELVFDAAGMFYTVVPSYSAKAYLTASFKNTLDTVLMPGPVTLYLDDNYSGRAALNSNIDMGEEVKFSFGVDENVKIEREKLPSKTGESGFFGSEKKVDYAYKITMKNYKEKAITMYVKEAIPYPVLDKIKVDFYEESIKHDSINDKNIYTWQIKVLPKEKKELVYRFNVTYPKDMNVSGL